MERNNVRGGIGVEKEGKRLRMEVMKGMKVEGMGGGLSERVRWSMGERMRMECLVEMLVGREWE